jgi:cation transport regulator ChaB
MQRTPLFLPLSGSIRRNMRRKAAFNHAFAAHSGDPRQEEAAHRIAWTAVKRSYVKVGNDWIAHADLER